MLELTLLNAQIQASECLEISKLDCLKSLKLLNLSQNHIGVQGIANLFQADRTNLNKLEHLTLYDCGITIFKIKSFKFPKLCSLNLKHANLSYNPCFEESKMSYYIQSLIRGQSLQELILVQTRVGITDVAEVVRLSPNLKYLDLSENPNVYSYSIAKSKTVGKMVEHIGMLHTLKYLSTIAPKVETLMTPLLVGERMTSHHNFRSVIELDLSNYNLGDTFVFNVLSFFIMPSIRLLKYDDNNLTRRGLSQIFAIEGLKSLKILSAQRNDIVANHGVPMKDRIQGPYNDMADPESWEKTMSLEILNLSGNKRISVKDGKPIVTNARNFLRTTIVICDECKRVQGSEIEDQITFNVYGSDHDLIRPIGWKQNALTLSNLTLEQK